MSGSFIALDDDLYITENRHVQRGLTPETALWALTSTEHANWYPLRRLSHLTDVSLFGMDARGHHLVSVAWHAAAAVLLFLALRLLTGATWRSFVAAGLFAVHPLQVESVAWAAERSNVQAGFFLALTLLAWTGHLRRPEAWRYGAAVAAGALALAAKPVLVPLPLVLLLLDFWPLGRMLVPGSHHRVFSRRLLTEKIPFFLLSAGAAAVTIVAHRQAGGLLAAEVLPLETRLANAAFSCIRYIAALLWPAGLAVYYPHPGRGLAFGPALASALGIAAVTVLALRQARRRPWFVFGWLWYLVMLAPVSGIVQFGSHARADRFAYLPSIGLFLALVWLASEIQPLARRSPWLTGALAMSVLAAASTRQASYWKDSESLFERTLAVTRDNALIHNNFATYLKGKGRLPEAMVHLQEVIRIAPGLRAEAYSNLGNILASLGRTAEAVDHYRQAIRLRAAFPDAHYNLGLALESLRSPVEAEQSYREAIRQQHEFPAAHTALGRLLVSLGRYAEAEASYREAIRQDPRFAFAHTNLGALLAREGRLPEAEASLREAIRLRPDMTEPWVNLGYVLLAQGRHGEAEAAYREALRRTPDSAAARAGLGRVLAAQGGAD